MKRTPRQPLPHKADLKRLIRPNRPAPPEIEQLLQLLPNTWKLSALDTHSVGWTATFDVSRRRFQFSCSYRYISVCEIVGEKVREFITPSDQRISITPEQVCALLNRQAGAAIPLSNRTP